MNYKGYGVIGLLILLINVSITKFIMPKARIIRMPFYFKTQGIRLIGKGFSSNAGLVIDVFKNATLNIGENFYANYRLHIGCANNILIGNDNLFGSDCLIIDHSHGSYTGDNQSLPNEIPVKRDLMSDSIVIGDNCWFGDKVVILQGVNIGDGVIVGANSVVSRSLPSGCIAVGSPAVPIKSFNPKTKKWEKEIS